MYADHQGEYDLVVAVNTAAMRFPCDWWCFKDQPFPRHVGVGRRYGLPAEPRPTGLCILGKRIDLGFDEDKPFPSWYSWTDVYLLTPAPPWTEIRYVLPQWPQER